MNFKDPVQVFLGIGYLGWCYACLLLLQTNLPILLKVMCISLGIAGWMIGIDFLKKNL